MYSNVCIYTILTSDVLRPKYNYLLLDQLFELIEYLIFIFRIRILLVSDVGFWEGFQTDEGLQKLILITKYKNSYIPIIIVIDSYINARLHDWHLTLFSNFMIL